MCSQVYVLLVIVLDQVEETSESKRVDGDIKKKLHTLQINRFGSVRG